MCKNIRCSIGDQTCNPMSSMKSTWTRCHTEWIDQNGWISPAQPMRSIESQWSITCHPSKQRALIQVWLIDILYITRIATIFRSVAATSDGKLECMREWLVCFQDENEPACSWLKRWNLHSKDTRNPMCVVRWIAYRPRGLYLFCWRHVTEVQSPNWIVKWGRDRVPHLEEVCCAVNMQIMQAS